MNQKIQNLSANSFIVVCFKVSTNVSKIFDLCKFNFNYTSVNLTQQILWSKLATPFTTS